MTDLKTKVYGCLLGQICGDALGAQVEFTTPTFISGAWPNGVTEMKNGGTFDLVAGQITDDTEMAFELAYSLIETHGFDKEKAREYYRRWLNSGPFDCGITISCALRGRYSDSSEANGALMRVCPLAIYGAAANVPDDVLYDYACKDASITHITLPCLELNALYVLGMRYALTSGKVDGRTVYNKIVEYSKNPAYKFSDDTKEFVKAASASLPKNYSGWVKVAFQLTLYYLNSNSTDIEKILADIIGGGGDTDTNAAIVGAMLGAVYGESVFPKKWINTISKCEPKQGKKGVKKPRPERYWPSQWDKIADKLLELKYAQQK